MSKRGIKSISLILLILMVLLTISCVSAQDTSGLISDSSDNISSTDSDTLQISVNDDGVDVSEEPIDLADEIGENLANNLQIAESNGGKYLNEIRLMDYITIGANSEILGINNDFSILSNGNTGTFNDLEAAINSASANSVLDLDADYTYDASVDIHNTNPGRDNTNRQYNGIFIFKNLTINGNGHTIDASAINRTFLIYGFCDVTIKNVTFINGKSDKGSAIYSAGTLTLEDCTFFDGTNYYDDESAYSSGSVVQGEATRYIVINDEDSYNAALADPASQLNRYYYAFSREDGIKEDGTPARSGDFVYSYGWESAITAGTTPAETSTFPWIIVNGVGFTDDLVFKYDDEIQLIEGPVYWSVKVYSVPNDLGMTDYRLQWGTGAPGEKTFDASKVDVLFEDIEGTYTDLYNRIDKTPVGGTLELPYDFTYNADIDGASFINGVVVSDDLTIDGKGFTICGNDAARIFNVTGGTLTLDNVIVCDGAAGDGAGVYVASGASLVASDVIFEDNVALDNGGAVYTDGGEISLTDCVLDANDVANLESSAFDNKGGAAIYAKDAQLTLVNTNVTNNGRSDLDRSKGDMINAVINLIDSNASITGGLFENNTGIYGGAIFADGDGSQTLTVSGATFNNNKGYNGGAIDISNMVTTISDCEFNDNWVIGPGSKNYYALGGAVAADGNGSFTLTGSNFTGNHADGVNGSAGAVSVGLDEDCIALIDDCEFKDNTAVFKAGAVFIAGYDGDATISDSKFSGNDAEMGDAIYNGGFLALAGNTIEGNGADIYTNNPITTQAWVIVNDNTTIDVEYYDTIPIVVKITDDMGNFIRINEPTLEIDLGDRWTRVALTLDEATGFYTTDAYLVDQKSGLLTPSRTTLDKYISGYTAAKNLNSTYINMIKANPILNVTYENVTYPGDVVITVNLTGKAGAPKINWAATAATPFKVTVNDVVYKVKITNGIGTVTVPDLPVGEYVINASWDGNTKYNGVGPQYYDLTVTYLKGTYTDLQAQIDAAIAAGETLVLPYDFAYNESYDGANFIDGVVINNDVVIDGKGYTICGNDKARVFNVTGGTLTLNNVTICDGNASEGAGVYVNAGAALYASDVIFENNTAVDNGGAIYTVGGEITLTDSVLDNNDVTKLETSSSEDRGGAAIYAKDAQLTLTKTNVTNNGRSDLDRSKGDLICGVVHLIDSNAIINGGLFENNTGIYGGAINIGGDGTHTLKVTDTTFNNNKAYNGGAINGNNIITTISNCNFTNNWVVGPGSSGYHGDGGAIAVDGNGSLNVTDSKFNSNRATGGGANGGAIYVSKGNGNSVEISMDNCTFEKNQADNMGGALMLWTDYNVPISTCKFIDNSVEGSADEGYGGAIYFQAKTLELTDSLFKDNNASNVGGAIYIYDTLADIDNVTFDSNNAVSGGAIYADNSVHAKDSRFIKNNATEGGAIYFSKWCEDSSLTNSNFTDNDATDGSAIYNNGILTLLGNDISTTVAEIVSGPRGKVVSDVYVTVLDGNKTIPAYMGEEVVLNATVTDDMGNLIEDSKFNFTVDGKEIPAVPDTGIYTADYKIAHAGETVVSVDYVVTGNLHIETGIYVAPKVDATLIITTGQNNKFEYGDNVTIFVTLTDERTGEGLNDTIKVVINNTDIPVELIDGTVSFNVTGYEPGQYAITAIFDGNENYNGPVYDSAVFEVLYPDRILSIEVEDIKYGEVAVINITITDSKGNKDRGIVVLNISGTEISVSVDGNKSVEIGGLDLGQYTINATLLEEGLDTQVVNDTESFKVLNNTLKFGIYADDVIYPDAVTINVFCPVDGMAYVTISNESGVIYKIDILVLGGVGEEIINLLPGNYSLNATYKVHGYDEANGTDNFTVEKGEVKYIMIEGSSVVYGQDAYVWVFDLPEDATGTVTVTIGDKTFTANVDGGMATIVINGLAAGDYELFDVTYSGDDKYNGHSGMATVKIIPANSSVLIEDIDDVTYGDDVNVTFTIENETEITITVIDADGNNVTEGITFTTGEVIISGLKAGEYTIIISNAGDENHTESFDLEQFNVNKANLTITPQVSGDLVVDGKINVTFTLPGDVNASSVFITVDGVPGSADSKDGIHWVAEFDNFNAGDHIVTAFVVNDPNYNNADGSVRFDVSKVDPEIIISDIAGNVGDSVEADVTITGGDATGYIFYEGILYGVTNGTATIFVDIEDAGMQSIEVYYIGDDKYNNGTGVKGFNAGKAASSVKIIAISDYPTYPDDVSVMFEVVNATEISVVISQDGAPVEDANIVVSEDLKTVTISGLGAGDYTINITNVENGNYTGASDSDSFTVYQATPVISVTAEDVTYNADVVVTVLSDASGTATVTVGDKMVTDAVEAGVAKDFTISGLAANEEGYTISVCLAETQNYTAGVNDTEIVRVMKAASSVEIEPIVNVVYNASVEVIYAVDNATNIEVHVLDANNTPISAGVDISVDGKVIISNLAAGEYTIVITNAANDNYTESYDEAAFEVYKASSIVEIEPIADVVYNASVEVTYTVENATEITIAVLDADNNPISAGVDISVDGKVTISDLAAGEYTIEIYNAENENYTGSFAVETFKVLKATATIDLEATGDFVVDGIVNVTFTVPTDIDGRLDVIIDGEMEPSFILINGTCTITGTYDAGNHTVIVSLMDDTNYENSVASITFDIEKLDPETSITAPNIVAGNDATITVTVPGDAIGAVLFEVDGNKYYAYIENGAAVLTLSELAIGNHTVYYNYVGDDKYLPDSGEAKFEVFANDTYKIIAESGAIQVGDNATVNVLLPEDAQGLVFVTVGNDTYSAYVFNGQADVIVPGLPEGSYTAEVYYSGDDKYALSNTTAGITVDKVANVPMNITALDVEADETPVIIVELPEDATGDVTVTVGNDTYTVPVEDGLAVIILDELPVGNYTAEVAYSGDDKYESVSDTANFTVDKVSDTFIDAYAEPVEVGEDTIIQVLLPEDATGKVRIEINGIGYYEVIVDGVARFEIENLTAGEYEAEVAYSGDGKYDPASITVPVVVEKVHDAEINATSEPGEYGSPAIIKVTLPEDATGIVVADIDGELYAANVENGVATIAVPGLEEGNYTAEVTYYGDDKYGPVSAEVDIEVTNGLRITAPDVIKYYHGPERFVVYTTDYAGNPIDNITVKITINGRTYERTSENGQASLGLNLNSGNYSVTVEFAGNEQYEAQNVTADVEILPTIFANDVVKVFRNDTQYYAQFVDSEGNPLVNTEVTFNINGVMYKKTTDESGWAKLNINLPAGEYILTAINPVTGEMISSNITVLSQFAEHGDLVKVYGTSDPYVVQIRTKDGNIAGAGETVTFNINGVIYNKVTNETGHAVLNINLPPGEYIITGYYNDERVSDKITVVSA